ncbi:hypothetical protein AMS68_003394 [Peltaster fructicola]|uniref:Gag1-like clamp domain-containing protein n=1 Tax=Peltaster fructicola TaxID=286661 RepID=A0A6H0XSY7_9PEZI|nr:hypothetical protein AMS68_003394 [Peltaster fructicola]
MHLLDSGTSKEIQQQESKESRRLFKENIRTDWDYPALPAYRTNKSTAITPQHTVGGFKVHQATPPDVLEQIIPEVVDWRERYYGDSDSDMEESEAAASQAKSKTKASYLFEGPDSVGEQLSDRALLHKRKRQKSLAEEMTWNEGLQHFIIRRDLWTGARTVPQIQLMRSSKSAVSSAAEAYNASVSSSPRSSTSMQSDLTHTSRPSTATTSPDPVAMSMKEQLPALDLMVPVMSQLLTAHPVRKKIGPSMYSEIYSKIILQARTPAVPINLLSLSRALVHGWKADGEWPPRPSAPEPSITRKKAHNIKQVVTRVLKISGTDSGKDKKPG